MGGWGLTPDEWSAVERASALASVATVVSLPFGVALGYLLARRRFVGKAVVETVVNLPLVLPPVVTGYVLLLTFGRRGWVGALVARLARRLARLHLAGGGPGGGGDGLSADGPRRPIGLCRRGRSARTGGADAGRWSVGDVLSHFAAAVVPRRDRRRGAGVRRSLGEFGATIVIAGNTPGETQTMPLYVYAKINSPGGVGRVPGWSSSPWSSPRRP